jgi:ubiquinone biosynthesis monooxygenase Coq7
MANQRHYSSIDRLLLQADIALRTLMPFSGQPYRPSPAIATWQA